MEWLLQRFEEYSDRPAVSDSVGDFSYADLLHYVHNYRDEISGKIPSGEVVAILSDYNVHAIALLLVLVGNGNIVVPITSTVQDEITNRLRIGQVERVLRIVSGELEHQHLEAGDKHALTQQLIDAGNAGLILFSSGSTGEPKAMIHNMDTLVESYRERKTKKLHLLLFLMFDHIGGLNTLISTLAMCAHVVIPADRDADHVAALIERHKVNVLPVSPTFLNLLLMSGAVERHDLRSLRMITYGTEPMPQSLLARTREVFPRARLLQTYGTSETGIAQASSRSSDSLEIRFDDPDMEYRIVDGELHLRTKTQVLGYLNASMEGFTEDGWFKTGDLVEQSDDGYLTIVGRSKEMINVGGEKVLPTEVESVLLRHPLVIDALVKGASNALTGQTVNADVVLTAGTDAKEAKQALRKHCREAMAAYKVPTRFHFVDAVNYSSRFKKMRLNQPAQE